ncbi:DUF459 domain-containing protein [Rhizobium sp. CFBP 8762]|uniref:SGNH/GDSL hydrolase family protein n=1 Tax=Rhizobium sp. CFBP 8762 TaxID=2775279 RepID=UPI00177F8EE1|nr:DUF459 domain-containing protein [Rhizobium sp. CFBP 8762]MBD8556263.1 DUF459 domain-containing protein [Rhizobium sp. CFBP 8762]
MMWMRAAAFLALGAVAAALPATGGAQAQEQRRTLFQMLFGNQQRPREPVYRAAPGDFPPPPRRVQKPRKAAPSAVTQASPTPAVEKAPDAKTVLVIGDFVASALGDGLQQAFETSPGVVIQTRANGSSGLVREDYFNWQTTLPSYLSETKPSVVVISLGANDRQQMTLASGKEKFRTPVWTEAYTSRIAALADTAKQAGIPLLWVGMPPFQSPSITTDMVTLNGLFKTEAEKANGQFIDIWDGFVDESGKFVLTGSDINGQQVRLRGQDGIIFTKAGKRKLAFYVEKDIRRLLGGATISATAGGSGTAPGSAGLTDLLVTAPIRHEDIKETQPIGITDPALDGGTELLGAGPLTAPSGNSPRDLLVLKGEVVDAPAGRVDDFRLER